MLKRIWKRNWLSKFSVVVCDTRDILGVAWRMNARLTVFYYVIALVAALAPLASSLTLARVIDHIVTSPARATVPAIFVMVVAMQIAIAAVKAALRHGLHEHDHDCLFRYRLQDAFVRRFSEKLAQLGSEQLGDPEVQTLHTRVLATHQYRVPDFFRMLARVFVATLGAVSAAIAVISFSGWIAAAVVAAALPTLVVRLRSNEMQRWSSGSGAPESRRLWYLGELLAEIRKPRELHAYRSAPSGLPCSYDVQRRIFTPARGSHDRHRRLATLAALIEGATVVALACATLTAVARGALSVGSFALFVTMLWQLARSIGDAGGGVRMICDNLPYVRHWNQLMALPTGPRSP